MQDSKKVLLLYITLNSGHHRATLAIETALKKISPSVETLNINAFAYTNPILERLINRTYMSVIKNRPEVWEYLYDNPKVLKSMQGLRDAMHRFNSKKLDLLLKDFKPDAVLCTQAFPCGMIADYKKNLKLSLPLFGVLTDYAPHSYWIFKEVDYYIVPSETSKQRFMKNGVNGSRIQVFGIPIDPKFETSHAKDRIFRDLQLDPLMPTILIMGGSQGLGPVENIVNILNEVDVGFQLIVVCGTNKKLEHRLNNVLHRYKKKVLIFAHVKNVDELMEVASIVITKPGGLTIAEALSKNLPMIIVHPIPGQEAKNTESLLQEGVAVKAEDCEDIATLVQELLLDNTKLAQMRRRAAQIKKPDAAMNIAELVLNM